LPGRTEAGAPTRPATPCSVPDQADPQSAPPEDRAVPTSPLRAGDVRAWGHGPLQGEVTEPDPDTVVLDVRDLRANTFVEGSVLFPRDVVPLEGSTAPSYGPDVSAGLVYSAGAVLAQEQRLADHANAVRARLRAL